MPHCLACIPLGNRLKNQYQTENFFLQEIYLKAKNTENILSFFFLEIYTVSAFTVQLKQHTHTVIHILSSLTSCFNPTI